MNKKAQKEEKETKGGAPVTRAEKKETAKTLIRELLSVKPYKHNELIDEVSKRYAARFPDTETENINDVRGRIGSVLDVMKKESEVAYDGGMYALKARSVSEKQTEKQPETTKESQPAPKKRGRKPKAKTEETPLSEAARQPEIAEASEPAPKKRGRKPKAKTEETPSPEAAKQPEIAETSAPAPKKRGRKPKAKTTEAATPEIAKQPETAEKAETTPVTEVKPEGKTEPKKETKIETKDEPKKEERAIVPVVAEKPAKQPVVMDMSFLFGDKATKLSPAAKPQRQERANPLPERPSETRPAKIATAPAKEAIDLTVLNAPKTNESVALGQEVEERKNVPQTANKEVVRVGEKPKAEIEKLPQPKTAEKQQKTETRIVNATAKKPVRAAASERSGRQKTADEKLCEAFLKRMRALGGDYFEYYSVYLMERYSMRNGRRLEGLRICGGDRDGGIDGEIELTDKLGFRETIYIQSKNWNPEKGDERLWVVGETLLQQFIGACACRQAKDGKQNCRGVFITTSRFTPEAKQILEDLSEKIVGYDGEDLYEAAKECGFGVVRKNGEWALDETLLSGSKAFFNLL